MRRRSRLVVAGLALALAAWSWSGCGGDFIDTFVVVQETNNACQSGHQCPPPACPAGYPYSYDIQVQSCGVGIAVVCSDQPLCQAQIDAALDRLQTCDTRDSYPAEIPAD